MPKSIPDGQPAAAPYLCCHNATEALAFYAKAFGAVEKMRLADPGGRIQHAEITIGPALIMLADEFEGTGAVSPATLEGTTVQVAMYVEDVDAFVARAVEAGAELIRKAENQFYGDRVACLVDPFGHCWLVSTRVEDVGPEEMKARFEKMMKG